MHALKYIQYSLETPQKRPHVDVMSEASLVDMTQGDNGRHLKVLCVSIMAGLSRYSIVSSKYTKTALVGAT